MCFNEKVKSCVESCVERMLSRNSEEGRPLVEMDGRHSGGDTEVESQTGCNASDSSRQDEKEEDLIFLWHWPSHSGIVVQGWWLLTWPFSLLLYLTVPDCRLSHNRQLYPITFTVCILYIGSASYLVAWMITVIGDTARVPDSVMGLTFLAAGTSLPEAVSSVIVTNQGYGSMGLSSSLGSNTFDILLCLGLPWLIKSTIMPAKPGQHFVLINSKAIQYSAALLLSALMILYILLAFNKFKLDRKTGLLCLLAYVIFLIVATLNELNFYQAINLPICGW